MIVVRGERSDALALAQPAAVEAEGGDAEVGVSRHPDSERSEHVDVLVLIP